MVNNSDFTSIIWTDEIDDFMSTGDWSKALELPKPSPSALRNFVVDTGAALFIAVSQLTSIKDPWLEHPELRPSVVMAELLRPTVRQRVSIREAIVRAMTLLDSIEAKKQEILKAEALQTNFWEEVD